MADKKVVSVDASDRLSIFLELVEAHSASDEHVSSLLFSLFEKAPAQKS